jgi:aspartyl-tRNA(Asn)/glutamyl-tRNA(Gln) amidotransferase subunit C
VAIERSVVVRLAEMTRIGMSDEEVDHLTADMSNILAHVNLIQSVDTSAVGNTGSDADASVLRADEVRPSLSVAEVLANAPERHEDFFVVPAVLGES